MAEILEEIIGQLLKQKGYKLAMAESCTGGLLGHRITNIPGSSDYYLGSITAYAYEAKERLLEVNHETLEKHGAVSEETVLEMARGVKNALAADIGLSVSGIAGPGGGMPLKPVGTVWIGLSTPTGDWAKKCLFNGDRIQIKEQTAETALTILLTYLGNGNPIIPE
jgi:PncC family amidohydrolase